MVVIIKVSLQVLCLIESLGFGDGTALRPGILIRAFLDLRVAMYSSCYVALVLLWLFLILSFLLALPYPRSLPVEFCLWNSFLISIHGLAGTVSSLRWYTRATGFQSVDVP
jgi:hypothetical protein